MRVLFSAPNEHLRHLKKEFPELTILWWDKKMEPGYADVDAWVPNPSRNSMISAELLQDMPYLRTIATPSTGTNHIDIKACQKHGVKVLSLLDDRAGLDTIRASSEFTFQLILNALHRPFVQWKGYLRDDDMMRGNELYGKRVGIVGYGRIGKNIAKWVTAFGAYYETYDLYSKPEELYRIFRTCDIVLISCALNERTEGMITKEHLDLMKPGAVLVNTARAEIINGKDLVKWAKKGQQCYAADVLHGEVTGDHVNSELLSMANCIITPHIAGTTLESQEKAARIALGLLRKEKGSV